MKVTVRLLRPFSDAVGKPQTEVVLPEGATVRRLVVQMCEQYPRLKDHIYEPAGGITEYLTMFVNDKPVTDLDMAMGDGDEVLMMFPISGG